MKEVRSGLGTKMCVGWEEEGSKWWANVEPWGESAADLMVKEGPGWDGCSSCRRTVCIQQVLRVRCAAGGPVGVKPLCNGRKVPFAMLWLAGPWMIMHILLNHRERRWG